MRMVMYGVRVGCNQSPRKLIRRRVMMILRRKSSQIGYYLIRIKIVKLKPREASY
jgi:hypothetical protein